MVDWNLDMHTTGAPVKQKDMSKKIYIGSYLVPNQSQHSLLFYYSSNQVSLHRGYHMVLEDTWSQEGYHAD